MQNDEGSFDVKKFFDSLNTFADIKHLISDGEAESSYLECKAPLGPTLDRNLQHEIAKVISSFANTSGGVIIFGVQTDHERDLDVLTQPSPIADIKSFMKRLNLKLPLLIEPSVLIESKIIKEKPTDTKGLAVIYIAKTTGDPVIRKSDEQFYIRVGETSGVMPYEIVKRMFLGSNSPDLTLNIKENLIIRVGQELKIPFILENKSNYPAKSSTIMIHYLNDQSIESISSPHFKDLSSINKGKKIYSTDSDSNIYRGLPVHMSVTTIKLKRMKHIITMEVSIFSEGMRAKLKLYKIRLLSQNKVKVDLLINRNIY